jgi:hypothetical protein
MNTALKVLVTSVSFMFTGYSCALLLALLFTPIAGAVAHVGHPIRALVVAYVPLPLALIAGV